MVWVFLEILAAAAVGVLLVWWTLPGRKPEEAPEPEQSDDGGEGDGGGDRSS